MADDLGEARRQANLRLECLRLAERGGGPADVIVGRARTYADFVLGMPEAGRPAGTAERQPASPPSAGGRPLSSLTLQELQARQEASARRQTAHSLFADSFKLAERAGGQVRATLDLASRIVELIDAARAGQADG